MPDRVRVRVSLRRWQRLAPPVCAVVLAGCAPAAGGETAPALARTPEPAGVAEQERVAPLAPTDARSAAPVKRFRSVRGHVASAAPASVRIPAIGVDSRLESLGREPDGAVEVPREWSQAGWFSEGPSPGQPGPAVILGHVDSRAGPAVFYRLHQLRRGDDILVTLRDGTTVKFAVDRVERHLKDEFPTSAVYFPTLEPTLRLVTCGGVFDTRARSYRDNIIVFATEAR